MNRALCFVFVLAQVAVLGQQRNFVACPIVRDTKTVPCFLAEYEGELYYLGIQQDIVAAFHPPQLKHEVLVEGRVKPGPRVCGGIPLEPLTISVVKELNQGCNTLLPAEPGIDAPPALRGAGPSTGRLNTAPAKETLSGRQEFTIPYAFNDDYVAFSPVQRVQQAATYAKQTGAGPRVFGYRAVTVLSNGTRLVEKSGLAEKRAKDIAKLLTGLGLTNISVDWKEEPEPGDGQSDAAQRRVTILVAP